MFFLPSTVSFSFGGKGKCDKKLEILLPDLKELRILSNVSVYEKGPSVC